MVQKGKNIIIGTLVVYGLLVATHQGEFWPFSIYPMFSQAGHPWTRALVRDVTADSARAGWNDLTKPELPGTTFALNRVGINQNDLANFISKNEEWSPQQVRGLRKYFKGELAGRSLMVYKVQGRLSEEQSDSVAVTYIPYIYLRPDTTLFNPRLVD